MITAVPCLGPELGTIVGDEVTPMSLAVSGIVTAVSKGVMAASGRGAGTTVAVTVPVLHLDGTPSSQPWMVKVAMPVKVGPGS